MTNYSVFSRNPAIKTFETACLTAIPRHLEQYLEGEPDLYTDTGADHMQINLLVWKPTTERPLWTIVTSGMSAHPMAVPLSMQYYQRAELFVTLPATWPSLQQLPTLHDSQRKRYAWLYELLSDLARMPYIQDRWLGHGHTFRLHPDPRRTFPRSEFSGLLFEKLSSIPEEAGVLEIAGQPVHLLGLYALYSAELQYIYDSGMCNQHHNFIQRFEDAGIHEGIQPGRLSVLPEEH